MHYDICCLGHITLDKVSTPSHTAYMPGGTAYYFGYAMAWLKAGRFLLVTCLAPGEMKAVEELRMAGVEVKVLTSRHTVYFENTYGADSNDRTQRVLAKADPFRRPSLENLDARIFHLGTLLADDFAPEVIRMLSRRGKVSLDVQGYLRRVEGTEVKACDWDDKLDLLPHIEILKANEHEMESLTGETDPRNAALQLAEWGSKEIVLTLGDRGSVIYRDGVFHDIPAFPVSEVVDATGCGDTYMAGYLYWRTRGASIDEAGRKAAAMCTLKLGLSGPLGRFR